MVLERLVSVRLALKQPFWVFIAGGFISTVCLAFSLLVFPESPGIFSNFLITFSILPFMLDFARFEAAKLETKKDMEKMNIFRRHKDILLVYIAFFAGMVLTESIIFTILPPEVSERLFKEQIETIKIIRGDITRGGAFETIVLNNIGVLFLSFLFSFIFGAGAIYILSWNASILSTAIGMSAKSIGGVKAIPVAMLAYFPHGSLEILAYFIGAIAGGLVSVIFSKRNVRRPAFLLRDSAELMGVAVILLLIAGLIEVSLL